MLYIGLYKSFVCLATIKLLDIIFIKLKNRLCSNTYSICSNVKNLIGEIKRIKSLIFLMNILKNFKENLNFKSIEWSYFIVFTSIVDKC